MDVVQRCSKCGIISLKSNLHKDNTKNDGLKSNCKVCKKIFLKKTLVKIKNYYLEIRDKIITQQNENKN